MAFHFDDYGLMPTIRPARVWVLLEVNYTHAEFRIPFTLTM